jgi:hypothetical protein
MNIQELKNKVQRNLDDAEITFYTDTDITNSLQDGVDEVETYCGSVIKSTNYPKLLTLYYDWSVAIPDLLSIIGIWDYTNKRWLDPKSSRELDEMRWDWERWRGTPIYYCTINNRYTALVPWPSSVTGVYLILYKSIPNTISNAYVPAIPDSIISILENYSTGDMQEQAKEFTKAKSWREKYFAQLPKCIDLVKHLAKTQELQVLQPYLRFNQYGQQSGDSGMFIDNETPTGAIDGVNATFNLATNPNPTNSLSLTKNGQILYVGVGYTLAGSTITFQSGYIPQSGDLLRAWYRI